VANTARGSSVQYRVRGSAHRPRPWLRRRTRIPFPYWLGHDTPTFAGNEFESLSRALVETGVPVEVQTSSTADATCWPLCFLTANIFLVLEQENALPDITSWDGRLPRCWAILSGAAVP